MAAAHFFATGTADTKKKGRKHPATIDFSHNSGKTHQNDYPVYLCAFAPSRATNSFARICVNLWFTSSGCGQSLLKGATHAETG